MSVNAEEAPDTVCRGPSLGGLEAKVQNAFYEFWGGCFDCFAAVDGGVFEGEKVGAAVSGSAASSDVVVALDEDFVCAVAAS